MEEFDDEPEVELELEAPGFDEPEPDEPEADESEPPDAAAGEEPPGADAPTLDGSAGIDDDFFPDPARASLR